MSAVTTSGTPQAPGGPSDASSHRGRPRIGWRRVILHSTLLRSLALVIALGVILLLVSGTLSSYRDLQLAYGGYYFAALAGLTVLIGLSGQVSLGHGALMAIGAYGTALLIANAGWALVPALIVSTLATALIGIPLGVAASRLRGPYLAGATLALAVGLPSLADKFPGTFGGENGLLLNPPTPPPSLGANFSLEHWEAWVSCAGALVVLFLLYNIVHSGLGRSWRAVRDDEIAASLSGLHVARMQTLAFALSAGCAGLGGGLLAVVTQLAAPSAFSLTVSLALLTGVVLGGLGSLGGAVWGAALLVLLPNWTSDLSHSLSLSNNVSNNLPFAIYGIVLILVILAWPTGIQGALHALFRRTRGLRALARNHAKDPSTSPQTGGKG